MAATINTVYNGNIPLKQWNLDKEENIGIDGATGESVAYRTADNIPNAYIYKLNPGYYVVRGCKLIQFHASASISVTGLLSLDKINWVAFPVALTGTGTDFVLCIPEDYRNSWVKFTVTNGSAATYYVTTEQYRQ